MEENRIPKRVLCMNYESTITRLNQEIYGKIK
jgi:hypothetical protein